MAKATLDCIFFFLLSSFTLCSSETLVGCYYDARRDTSGNTDSLFMQNTVSPTQLRRVLVSDYGLLDSLSKAGHSIDVYLSCAQAEHLWNLKPSELGRLKSHFRAGNIKSITVLSSFSSSHLPERNELRLLLSSLRSAHTFLSRLRLQNQVKVSAIFRLSDLENLLSRQQMGDLDRIFELLRKARSFVTLEADRSGQLGSRVSVMNKASGISSFLSGSNVPVLLIVRSFGGVPSAAETACFNPKIVKSLGFNHQVLVKIIGLLTELAPARNSDLKDTGTKDLVSRLGRRELLADFNPRITSHDTFDPPTSSIPTVTVTDPSTTQPNFPSYTPTIVTVPGADPVTDTPTNPAALPVTAPPYNPVPIPPSNPVNSPVPVSNPTMPDTNSVAQPVTNPATTYPPPVGDNPVTDPVTSPAGDTPATNPVTPPAGATPVTNPVTPPEGYTPVTNPETPPAGDTPVTNPVTPPEGDTPVTNPVTAPATNAPTVSGQTWCIAKSGVSESALQAALDYACGIGGADCSMIQQGASCYDPSTLENHASYAFNSYYQKNPTPDGCGFGGTAVLVHSNPSTGSCVYPSSTVPPATTASSSSTVPPATTASPSSTVPPATTASPMSTVPPATTTSPFGNTVPPVAGSGSDTPSAPTSSYPGSTNSPLVFGSQGAPDFNTTTSGSTSMQHFMNCFLMIMSFAIGKLVLAP